MSWIEDAKRKASQEKQREEEEREKAMADERQRHQNNMDLFHQLTAKTKQEIDVVIAEARRQNLIVDGPEEGHFDSRHGKEGFLTIGRQEQECYDTIRTYQYAWAYRWTISPPFETNFEGRDRELHLHLSLKKQGKSLLVPSISAQEIKMIIKDWLYRLYKSS